jgi:hypothetical protein
VLAAALISVGSSPRGAQAAVPVPLPAPVILGIGDQKASLFTDPRFTGLGVRYVRRVVAWDALDVGWQRAELDAWMNAAHAAGVEPLIAFTRSRRPRFEHFLPTPDRLAQTFRKFRRRYRWVRVFTPWNEENHGSQPTFAHPRVAARYYQVMHARCPRCTILAADVLDTPNLVPWLRAFLRQLPTAPKLWGLHNYVDANKFRTTGTRAMLATVPGEIWFTEVGGIVRRVSRRTGARQTDLGESPRHAAQATRWLFHLLRLSPRIRRVYVYQWSAQRGPDERWDSALIAPNGRPRPAFWILRDELRRQRKLGLIAPG